MLLIYTHKTTQRAKYIFHLIFKDLLGLDFLLTDDIEKFKTYSANKLSYTYHQIDNELFFLASPLLFEKGINDQDITIVKHNEIPVLFPLVKSSSLPFDVFAASFFLVSRYEEYLPHIRDEHDRFEAESSIAFQYGFLHLPLVNIYAEWLKSILAEHFPDLVFKVHKFNFISTIDIDNAYAYLNKGVIRSLGGYLKSIIDLNIEKLILRTKVFLEIEKDPFDTYDYQIQQINKYQLKIIYFFLMGDYSVHDKNVSFNHKNYQKLIKSIGDYAEVGIHPSYDSNDSEKKLKIEITRLSKTLHRDITCSRQHYLRLRLPETYRQLIDADITDDYTMGYATDIGFRASICSSFNFYDLDREMETKLKIHPFAVMEGVLKYELSLNPQQAIQRIESLMNEVKKVNGTFISLWHNESLSEHEHWKGWRRVYEKMLEMAYENSSS